MIKRMIECCDFCKQEAELAASIEIKKGKKKGRAYELCMACAEGLETRLVAAEIPKEIAKAKVKNEVTEEDEDTLILDDGSSRPIPTREEIEEGGEEVTPLFRERPKGINKEGQPCQHMNKFPARLDSETRKVISRCRDCNAPLPYISAREKARAMNDKLPDDIRVNDSNKVRRGRD